MFNITKKIDYRQLELTVQGTTALFLGSFIFEIGNYLRRFICYASLSNLYGLILLILY